MKTTLFITPKERKILSQTARSIGLGLSSFIHKAVHIVNMHKRTPHRSYRLIRKHVQ